MKEQHCNIATGNCIFNKLCRTNAVKTRKEMVYQGSRFLTKNMSSSQQHVIQLLILNCKMAESMIVSKIKKKAQDAS